MTQSHKLLNNNFQCQLPQVLHSCGLNSVDSLLAEIIKCYLYFKNQVQVFGMYFKVLWPTSAGHLSLGMTSVQAGEKGGHLSLGAMILE